MQVAQEPPAFINMHSRQYAQQAAERAHHGHGEAGAEPVQAPLAALVQAGGAGRLDALNLDSGVIPVWPARGDEVPRFSVRSPMLRSKLRVEGKQTLRGPSEASRQEQQQR